MLPLSNLGFAWILPATLGFIVPADHDDIVGTVSFADAPLAQEAIGAAVAAFPE